MQYVFILKIARAFEIMFYKVLYNFIAILFN